MAIPPTAVVWTESMDPSDVLDFSINAASLLESGESISSYTVIAGPESVLLGLTVGSTNLAGNVIYVWLSVEASKQNDNAFLGAGATLPIEITVNTNRSRKWQRTAVVKVAQK